MNKKIINRYIKRGYASIGKWMGLLLLPLLLFSSCVDDSVTSDSTTSRDSTRVRLTFNLQQQTSLTRSLSSTGTSESQVDNINVLIFDNNSKLIGSTYQTYGTSQTSSFSVTVPTRVASGCTIYAVANLPSDSLKNVATVSDFNKKFILMSSASTLGSGSNMVMFGQTSGVTISATAASNTPSITLTRLGSKVTFNVTPATGITITGYQLCHVPMASYITSATDSTYFNAKGTYGNFDAVSNLSSTTTISPTFYTYENLVGRKSGATSYFSRSASNAPTDATYLLIYAQQRDSCWHAIYRIYLGGRGTNDYANYNIYRNYNCTYNIHIDGADAADVRVTYLVPKAGDYYYSDGNWSDGTVAPISGKTVIGIVFSATTSSTDQTKGWTHGYVMALKNAAAYSSGVKWSTNTSTSEFSDYSAWASMIADLNGYTKTNTIKTTYSSTLSSNYPAFYYALGYGTSQIPSTTTYAAPAGSVTSGWYLPSIGQWYNIFVNLGGMSTTPSSTGTGSGQWYNGSNGSAGYSYQCAAAINTRLSTLSSSGYSVDLFSNIISGTSDLYWSSSEYASGSAYAVAFNSNGSMSMGFSDKTSTYGVRPVLAF